MQAVTYAIANGIATVTLNRAEHGNAMNRDLTMGVVEAFEQADNDPAVRVIVTRAHGKAWCVGADQDELSRSSDRPLAELIAEYWLSPARGRPLTPGELALDTEGIGGWALRIAAVKTPSIAVIHAGTGGGGLGFAALHTFRIASENARFAGFSRIGLSREMGLTATLPRLMGDQATLDLLMLGRRIDGVEACRLGLVDRCVAADALEDAGQALATEIAALPPLAVQSAMRFFTERRLREMREVVDREWIDQCALFATEDFREGVAAFREKRQPNFVGR